MWSGNPPFPGCSDQEVFCQKITDAYPVKEVILIYIQIQNSYFRASVVWSYKKERIQPEQVY